MTDKLIPDDIRKRLHLDMDKIFDLQEENARLKLDIVALQEENAKLAKNQRIRQRPTPEDPNGEG